LLISVFIFLLIASITDIRKRIMYDYGTYAFALLFLILRILLFFETGNIIQLQAVYYYAVPTLVISYILYHFGLWGGGDLKILTALSIGLAFFSTDSGNPFFADFLINTLYSGVLWGLIWMIYSMIKNYKKVIQIIKKSEWIVLGTTLLVSIILLFLNNNLFSLLGYTIIFFELFYLIKRVEKDIQTMDKKVKELEEGDWIIEPIKINKTIIEKKGIGLTKEDIKLLQNSKLKQIKIRDGIPFVPSFLIAFIVTLLIGNWLVPFFQFMLNI